MSAGAVVDVDTLLGEVGDGVHWTLETPSQLNANLVLLGPSGSIGTHTNSTVDVLVVVVSGAGRLVVDGEGSELVPHVVAHIPRGAVRRIDADPAGEGLAYLTVHTRRPALDIGPRPGREEAR